MSDIRVGNVRKWQDSFIVIATDGILLDDSREKLYCIIMPDGTVTTGYHPTVQKHTQNVR